MCLAVPSKIITKNNLLAIVDVYGARREVSLVLLPEDVEEGDYVLVHAGFAIQKVDFEAAKETMKMQLLYAAMFESEEEKMPKAGLEPA